MFSFLLTAALLSLQGSIGLAFSCHNINPLKHSRVNQLILQSATSSVDIVKPTPKVPSSAWKWPSGWPFPPDFFEVLPDYKAPDVEPAITNAAVKSKFVEHCKTFTEGGMSTLEIGGLETALLPEANGLALGKDALGGNKPVLANLTCAVFPFEAQSFDRVVLSSSIDMLSNPRDVFREIWRVLKPDGLCIVFFSQQVDSQTPVKMWTTMNDEQKIWIVGSYFQYSAGEGWSDIEGYDLFGSSGVLQFDNTTTTVGNTGYAVQAKKVSINGDFTSDSFNVTDYLVKSFYAVKNMENDDKLFSRLRLAAEFEKTAISERKNFLATSLTRLPQIYEILREVKELVVPSPVKAMLASFMVKEWDNTNEQRGALRKGFGLDPIDEFWTAVSRVTMAVPAREKIIFLSAIIPLFGKSSKLEKVPALLEAMVAAIKGRAPEGSEDALIQGYAADLLVTDFLYNDKSDADRILRFLNQANIASLLQEHKNRPLK